MKKILISLITSLMVMSCGSDKIVVYTNSGNNGRQEFLEKYAKENGFNISVVTAGGTDIVNRLIAEKSKPIADVVFGLNAMEYEKLKKYDLFEKYTPNWAKDIPLGLSDNEGYYNAVTVTPLLAVYNKNAVPRVPKDWTDMAISPEFKDKYTLLGLGGGTGKAIFASVASRYRDDNGDLKVSDKGWEMVKSYFANAHIQRGEEDWYGKMMDGSIPVTMIWGSGAIERSAEFNFDYGVMTPEIGVPVVVEQLALVAGSTKKDKAKEFINWLGSAEVQSKWAQNFGTIPALPEALANAPKENQDLFNKVKIQNLDWKFISENIDAWVEKATLQYIK